MDSPSYSPQEIQFFATWYLGEYRKSHQEMEFHSNDSSYHGNAINYLSHPCLDIKTKLLIILELLKQSQNEQEIAFIAAGPLEEIIGLNDDVDTEIDHQVRINHLMRKAICGVWLDENTHPGKILRHILAKYDLKYSSL